MYNLDPLTNPTGPNVRLLRVSFFYLIHACVEQGHPQSPQPHQNSSLLSLYILRVIQFLYSHLVLYLEFFAVCFETGSCYVL